MRKNIQSIQYITQAIDERADTERIALFVIAVLLACVAGLYMYFVAHAAYVTADRALYAHEASLLESELVVLEGRYLSARAQVTVAMANDFGLQKPQMVAYAPVQSITTLSIEVR